MFGNHGFSRSFWLPGRAPARALPALGTPAAGAVDKPPWSSQSLRDTGVWGLALPVEGFPVGCTLSKELFSSVDKLKT